MTTARSPRIQIHAFLRQGRNVPVALWLILLSTFTLAQSAPSTVVEYYLALPDDVSAISDPGRDRLPDSFFFVSSNSGETLSGAVGDTGDDDPCKDGQVLQRFKWNKKAFVR